jgi:hypothetical protein
LPCLWAGFKPAEATSITGEGPELEAYCRRTGKSADRLLDEIRREYFGLSLRPFPWVSHHWQQAVAVFADLTRFPRRQVFRLLLISSASRMSHNSTCWVLASGRSLLGITAR